MTTAPVPSVSAALPIARPLERWIDPPAEAAPAARPLRVFCAGGSGDVGTTLAHWARGQEDPSITAITYSRQLFDAVDALGAELLLVTDNPDTREGRVGRIEVRGSQRFSVGRSGPRFHAEELRYALWLAREAKRWRADVFLTTTMLPHHALIPLARSGVRVIASLHNSLWPRELEKLPVMTRLNRRLRGLFWRRYVHATICVSPELERQIRVVSGGRPRGELRQVWAQYHRDRFDAMGPAEPPADGAWNLLYAGRVESEKGVPQMIAAFAAALPRLRAAGADATLEVCGGGSFLNEAHALARRLGVGPQVRFRGHLNQDALGEAFRRCHAVLVPTTKRFSEGLNKVCVESALARRPAVMTRATLADNLGGCGLIVPPDDPQAMADAIVRLCTDEDLYRAKVEGCALVREQFFDRSWSWGSAIYEILADIDRQRRGQPALVSAEAAS